MQRETTLLVRFAPNYTPQSYRVPQHNTRTKKAPLGSDVTHGYTFRPLTSSNRATAHQTIASSSRASLRSRGMARWQGALRIHRLATPDKAEWVKGATHPQTTGHRADMSCGIEAKYSMRRWMWSFLLLCPSSLIRDRALSLAAQRKSALIDPGEARRRKACCAYPFPHARWNRRRRLSSLSPPKLNLMYRTGAQAKLVGLALIACSVRSYLRRKRSCTLAADTGDAALRELSA